MLPRRTMIVNRRLQAYLLSGLILAGAILAPIGGRAEGATQHVSTAESSTNDASPGNHAPGRAAVETQSYRTELFGRKYRLEDKTSLAAYTRALEEAIAKTEKPIHSSDAGMTEEGVQGYLVSTHEGPMRWRATKQVQHQVNKKLLPTLEETHAVAVALATSAAPERQRLLDDFSIMAGAIRASTLRLLPGDLDVFTALAQEGQLRHPRVGLGRSGPANNVDAATGDPLLPSTFWSRPANIGELDLYHSFGRSQLPSLEGEICTYAGAKTGLGVHGGFEIRSHRYKKAKLKFGKQYSQPFAQRIFWALGFHTVPADYVPEVKVKWDRRILTEYNSRKDEQFSVKLFSLISMHTEHLQHYLDPFAPISEVVMEDENGKEITLKPQPNWNAFKAQLFKNPHGRPETVKDNFNEAFASKIKYLVYRHVGLQLKNDTEEEDEISLGSWDWNGEGTPGLRETRGAAFLAAFLNEFDPSVANNRLTMSKRDNGTRIERTFKHYISDVGVCLGSADDATRMHEQEPNAFPWTFTRPAREGETAIPFDGSYHPIKANKAFEAADIEDARWMARLLAQLTEQQIKEALIASGMPSACARLYYNKLANRRNQALEDLGISAPPLKLMDESREFDYDPQKDGRITITTRSGETVTAPDEGWVVEKGRITMRNDTTQSHSLPLSQ